MVHRLVGLGFFLHCLTACCLLLFSGLRSVVLSNVWCGLFWWWCFVMVVTAAVWRLGGF